MEGKTLKRHYARLSALTHLRTLHPVSPIYTQQGFRVSGLGTLGSSVQGTLLTKHALEKSQATTSNLPKCVHGQE